MQARIRLCLNTNLKIAASLSTCWVAVLETTIDWASIILPMTPPLELAEAIRIGTATTGRLITAAALVLAVVAGSFMFSDLVMMKYLAFGLAAALLLDATVVRMFLVPSVMKLLGDDCWWAPR